VAAKTLADTLAKSGKYDWQAGSSGPGPGKWCNRSADARNCFFGYSAPTGLIERRRKCLHSDAPDFVQHLQGERMKPVLKLIFATVLAAQLAACGINNIPTLDEQVKASWAQVQNQYQRRADLIPNLVETVRGYANQEQETLVAVTEARARVASMQVDANLINNPEQLKQFEQAQAQLSGALSRLMVVVERYPELKSNQNFLALQSQLEGTENRIAVSRRDYIEAVQRYNTEIRTLPGKLWHMALYSDLPVRETFEATAPSAESAPQVKFD
jgi:LemA protein